MKKIIIIPILISLVICSFDFIYHYKQRNKKQTETEKKEIVYVGLKRITIDDSFVYFYDTQTDVMYLQSRSSGNVIQLIECTGKPMLYHKHFRP